MSKELSMRPVTSFVPGASLGFDRWLKENRLGFVLLPIVVCAVGLVVEKTALAIRLGLFSFLMATPVGAGAHLLLLQRVSLVRADILFGFVVVPVVFVLATYRVPFRWQMYAAWALAFLVQATVIVECASLSTTGAFSSIRLIWFGAVWAFRTRDFSYFGQHHGIFSVLIASPVVAVLVYWLARAAAVKNRRWVNNAVLITISLGAFATLGAYDLRAPDMAWSQTLPRMTARGAFIEGTYLPQWTRPSAAELVRKYRVAENVPLPQPTAFTGRAKDANVLLFVMEAMPADAFDPARDDLADMPNFRSLRDRAFVAREHYTSYPLTDDATFSIFTSLYANLMTGILDHPAKLPGLVRTLRDRGYETGFYGYVWNFHHDGEMLKSLGFEKIVEPTSADWTGHKTFFGPVDFVEKNDLEVMHSLENDIRNWTRNGHRFAAAYFPEVGHDPYRSVAGCKTPASIECAHAIAVVEDAWLGEMLRELQRDGVLNNTLIVVTGDHGMRFVSMAVPDADPNLPIQPTLDETMLRVPMLIYAPGVLQHPMFLEGPTSHIDVCPTLFDLLGVTEGRELEEGSPMYLPALSQRRLFLDMKMFGASGFVAGGKYYSRNGMGIIYENDKLQFETGNMIPFDTAEADRIRTIVQGHEFSERDILKNVLSAK